MLSYDASGTIAFKNVYADDPRGGWHKPTNSPMPLTVAKAVDESALHEECGSEPISVDELMANARLIAAAPELYETGRKLCSEVAGILSNYEYGLRELMGNTNFAVLKHHYENARAALAKVSPQDVQPNCPSQDQSEDRR